MKTASTPSPVTSDGQARKLVDQLVPRLMEAIMDGRLPAEQFQQLIQSEKELKLGTRFVEWLISMMELIVGCVVVRCNYGAKNPISEALEAANFDFKYLGLSADYIPLIGKGKVNHWIGELCFGSWLETKEIIATVKDQTAGFATPLAALRYAAMFPDRQRRYPLATIFEVVGQLWSLSLDEDDDGERRVEVSRVNLGDGWGESCRFLVICKPAPATER